MFKFFLVLLSMCWSPKVSDFFGLVVERLVFTVFLTLLQEALLESKILKDDEQAASSLPEQMSVKNSLHLLT